MINGVWVNPIGKAGGLALLWNTEETISLRSMNNRYIDVSVLRTTGGHLTFTGIYGWAEHGQKHNMWNLLKHLGNESDMAWLIGGDFNEILFAHKKRGGNPSDFSSMKAFRDSLDCFNRMDVKLRGYPFTWCNGRK